VNVFRNVEVLGTSEGFDQISIGSAWTRGEFLGGSKFTR